MPNLSMVSKHGWMTQGQPTLLDDNEVEDQSTARSEQPRANFLKQFLSVKDGGEVGARNNQINIQEKQPRNICNMQQWHDRGLASS